MFIDQTPQPGSQPDGAAGGAQNPGGNQNSPSNIVGWAVPGVEFARPEGSKDSAALSLQLDEGLAAVELATEFIANIALQEFPLDNGAGLIKAETRLRAAEERLFMARLAMLTKIDDSGEWKHDYLSVGKFNTWLAQHDDIERGTANREARLAQQLATELPETRGRALNGEATSSQVKAIATIAATSDTRKEALRNPVTNWEPVDKSTACCGCCSCPDCNNDETTACQGGCCSDCSNATASAITDVVPPTGEAYLLDMAAAVPLYQFNRLVKRFAHITDPEADERGYKEAKDREYFEMSATLGGYHLAGFLTEEHGQLVKTAIDSLVNTTLTSDGNIVQARATRTDTQRRAQSLADLAKLALDTSMLGGGAIERNQIALTISWTELQTLQKENHNCDRGFLTNRGFETRQSRSSTDGIRYSTDGQADPQQLALDIKLLTDPATPYPTYADGRGPIPPTVLKRLLCDCSIRRIIFGPDSQILDVGRTQRTVPPHIRTAVIARDKHCVYPGCDQPAQRCEVHHAVTHWADGGDTSAENSALLCWHHHAHVDDNGIIMRWADQTSNWQFTTKHGQPISREKSLTISLPFITQ